MSKETTFFLLLLFSIGFNIVLVLELATQSHDVAVEIQQQQIERFMDQIPFEGASTCYEIIRQKNATG